MRFMRFVLPKASLLSLFLLFQCSDDGGSGIPAFRGITETNSENYLSGKIDDSDWQLNENWSPSEIALFSDLGISNLNNSNINAAALENALAEILPCSSGGRTSGVCDGTIKAVDGYPNPASYFTNLKFNVNDSAIKNFKLVIVNQSFDELFSTDEFSANYTFDFDLSGLELEPDHIYRVYYLIQTTNSDFVLKGHGDIKVI